MSSHRAKYQGHTSFHTLFTRGGRFVPRPYWGSKKPIPNRVESMLNINIYHLYFLFICSVYLFICAIGDWRDEKLLVFYLYNLFNIILLLLIVSFFSTIVSGIHIFLGVPGSVCLILLRKSHQVAKFAIN